MKSLPGEADEAHNIDNNNCNGNYDAEDRLHPILYLGTDAGIGLGNHILPTPAVTLGAAEENKDERADGQKVIGNDEIPEVQPCGAFSEGLEGKLAVTESGGGSESENNDTADDAALGAAPTGHFADAGENVLEYGEHGGHSSEDHEQEEDGTPQTAAGHVVEYGSHGVEEEAGACADFHVVGEASGEDDKTGSDGNEGVQNNNVDGLTHEGALLVDIAAEDSHGAYAKAKREECLVHCAYDYIGIDLAEVGKQIELETFLCAVKSDAVDGKDNHEEEESDHHVLGDALKTALQIEAEYEEADYNNDTHEEHVDTGVGDHGNKADISGVAGYEAVEIINHPTGDDGVESHKCYVAEKSKITVDMPFLTGLLQLLIHSYGAGLSRTTQRELHNHNGKTKENQAENVDKYKAAAAVRAGHPGELPYVAAADGAACAEQDETKARG